MTLPPALGVAVDALSRGDTGAAITALAALQSPKLLEGTPTERVTGLVARALLARARGDSEGVGNLYDLDAGPEEMLTAFQALISHTPLVRFGHVAANLAILALDPGHVVDIGIGFGSQWADLVGRLPPGRRLTLHGVEVPAAGPDPLAQLTRVGAMLAERAAAAGIELAFTPLAGRIEDLHLAVPTGAVINAALALHHLADGDAVTDPRRSRDAVLTRLRALSPRALVLVEPDVEHNALPFAARVPEAARHYGLTLEALASGVAEGPRRVIERAFFGREIVNVTLGEGPARVERHERHASWTARLTRLGWRQLPLGSLAPTVAAELALGPPYTVTDDGGALALRWNDEAILVVSAWE